MCHAVLWMGESYAFHLWSAIIATARRPGRCHDGGHIEAELLSSLIDTKIKILCLDAGGVSVAIRRVWSDSIPPCPTRSVSTSFVRQYP